jgi:hypothetical protein
MSRRCAVVITHVASIAWNPACLKLRDTVYRDIKGVFGSSTMARKYVSIKSNIQEILTVWSNNETEIAIER